MPNQPTRSPIPAPPQGRIIGEDEDAPITIWWHHIRAEAEAARQQFIDDAAARYHTALRANEVERVITFNGIPINASQRQVDHVLRARVEDERAPFWGAWDQLQHDRTGLDDNELYRPIVFNGVEDDGSEERHGE